MAENDHLSEEADLKGLVALTDLLRACTDQSGVGGSWEERRLEKAIPLVAWLDEQARALTNSGAGMEPSVLLRVLPELAAQLEASTPLWEDAATAAALEPEVQRQSAHAQFFVFCELVLTHRMRPGGPGGGFSEKALAKHYEVSLEKVRGWLGKRAGVAKSDGYGPPNPQAAREAALVLLRALVAFATAPEDPTPSVPESVDAFSELVSLGGLRRAFPLMYGPEAAPKPAQRLLLPRALKRMADDFTSDPDGEPAVVPRLCIVAPTNAGKNGIILGIALMAMAWGRKPVFVLQPHRVQIAESLRDWSGAVENLAYRPAWPSGSATVLAKAGATSSLIRSFDSLLGSRRVDLVSAIPEKFAALVRDARYTKLCSFLIVDEIAHLLDEERGPKLEIIMSIARTQGLPVVAIGAAVSERAATRIAQWLAGSEDALPVRDDGIKREPPLDVIAWKKGGDRVLWRGSDETFDFTLPKIPVDGLDEQYEVANLVLMLLRENPEKQVLVFGRSRSRVTNFAKATANLLTGDGRLLQRLDDAAQVQGAAKFVTREQLRTMGRQYKGAGRSEQLFAKRVAIHSRELSADALRSVEELFRAGQLRVLFATSTVEAGINLPVDTVIQVELLDHRGRELRQAVLEQRLGRAGRTVRGRSAPAQAIIYLRRDDPRTLKSIIEDKLLRPDPADRSSLNPDNLALLLLVAAGTEPRTVDFFIEVLGNSFWAWGQAPTELEHRAKQLLRSLEAARLVVPIGREEDSSLGVATSGSEEPTLIGEGTDGGSEYAAGLELLGGDSFQATFLGQALAVGMHLPADAPGIERVAEVALQENHLPREIWAPAVLFAACEIASIVRAELRPRISDLRGGVRGSLGVVALASWCVRDARSDRVAFGIRSSGSFVFTRMFGVGDLREAMLRAGRQQGSARDNGALLLAYCAWSWIEGADLWRVSGFVEDLDNHIVEQELAYFVAHIIRSTAHLVRLHRQETLSLRLEQLATELDAGVPADVVDLYRSYGAYAERSEIVSSRADVTKSIPAEALSTISDLMAQSETRRWHRLLNSARAELELLDDVIASGKDEFSSPLDRIEELSGGADLAALLADYGAWRDVDWAAAVRVLPDGKVAVGDLVFALVEDANWDAPGADIVVVNKRFLGPGGYPCVSSGVAVLDLASLVGLITVLTRVDGLALVERIASSQRLLSYEYVVALGAEIERKPMVPVGGDWSRASLEEVDLGDWELAT
jgi:hypothetical protein